MYDIFDAINEEKNKANAPLAERMRPVSLREFLGQSHICEEDRKSVGRERVC